MDEKPKPKINTTAIKTKSGTEVYVVGTTAKGNRAVRVKAGDKFVDVYNRNFTEKEQRQIGNILYDLYDKHRDSSGGIPKGWLAATGTFTGKTARRLNPHHKKMVDVNFAPDGRQDESCITHELIHAKKFMLGIKGNQHNERKVDFEAVGRISRHGVITKHQGYYFAGKEGNPHLARKKGMRLKEKVRISKEGVYADRRLLTGSLSNSIIGKTAERKVNNLFPRSFFFKRKF